MLAFLIPFQCIDGPGWLRTRLNEAVELSHVFPGKLEFGKVREPVEVVGISGTDDHACYPGLLQDVAAGYLCNAYSVLVGKVSQQM